MMLDNLENIDLGDLRQLCEVANDFDAEVMISLLRSCGIPAFKRYGGFASAAKVYCGNSNLGVKVYVPSAKLEEAEEIIHAPFDQDEFENAGLEPGGTADEEVENEEG